MLLFFAVIVLDNRVESYFGLSRFLDHLIFFICEFMEGIIFQRTNRNTFGRNFFFKRWEAEVQLGRGIILNGKMFLRKRPSKDLLCLLFSFG